MSDQYPPQSGAFGTPPPNDPPVPAPPTPPGQAPLSPLDAAGAVLGDTKGFLPSLFDFSFTHFVTPKLVKFVYLLATVALGLMWFVVLLTSFANSVGAGLGVLIIGPIILVIYLALIRMTLEFYLSVVRMSQDINQRLPKA